MGGKFLSEDRWKELNGFVWLSLGPRESETKKTVDLSKTPELPF